ncbi:hypothetical protein T09_11470 [Trichinella sp. T9]|nr:hypothetical protein T09_11470 [Trichinella sp. T9]
MNTDVNASVITVDEIEVIKNDFDRTEGTIDSYTGTLRGAINRMFSSGRQHLSAYHESKGL